VIYNTRNLNFILKYRSILINVIIRKADKKDLNEIFKIEVSSFKNPYPRQYLEFLMIITPDFFLVAEENNEIIGYVVGIIRKNKTGHIVSIAVSPKHRRKKVGQKLLDAILTKFKKRKLIRVKLEVKTTNIPAISLYLKNGFQIVKRIKEYYPNGEDCYVMEKDL